jgi:hypothetical protein
MTDVVPTPTVMRDSEFRQLKQVTVREDDEIKKVNDLLADGWRVLSIGQRSDATVYVLGRTEEKQRTRTGFLPAS